MKKFNPEMKVVRFRDEDVIVTSGVTYSLQNQDRLELRGFGLDDDPNNNYVTLNRGKPIYLLSNEDSRKSVLSALGATRNERIYIPGTTTSLEYLFSKVDGDTARWNGVYHYNSSTSTFNWIQQ